MSYVALFRNLNLGHPGSPSGAVLVDAFGGSASATNFQTNGTVVFETDDPSMAAERARVRLDAAGFDQHFVVRALSDIAAIVSETPVVDPAENIYRLMVSFYDIGVRPQIPVPLRSQDDLVEVRRVYDTHAWSACWKPKNTAGNVTGFLESLLETPVTTRTAATLERLTRKHWASHHAT